MHKEEKEELINLGNLNKGNWSCRDKQPYPKQQDNNKETKLILYAHKNYLKFKQTNNS